MRDDGDDGGVEFQQGCFKWSLECRLSPRAGILEGWEKEKKQGQRGFVENCLYMYLGRGGGHREKEGFYLVRQSLGLGLCLSFGRLSSPLVWEGVAGVQ